MQAVANSLGRMWRKDDGVTAIEYALIVSVLGLSLVPVLINTTSGVASLLTRVQDYSNLV